MTLQVFNTLKNLQHTPSILQCHNRINVKTDYGIFFGGGGLFCIEYSDFYPPIRFEF